jgi:hypothetical protein
MVCRTPSAARTSAGLAHSRDGLPRPAVGTALRGSWKLVGRRHTIAGVPSFDVLEPLGPDACRSDHSAPCYYLDLKRRALNGERDKLSERDCEFVGVDTWPINTPGWRSPVGLYLDDPLEGFGLSAEDSAALHAIMTIGSQERLEFLRLAPGLLAAPRLRPPLHLVPAPHSTASVLGCWLDFVHHWRRERRR